MDDLKKRLHQIACCAGECRENRIEAWERIAKLKAQLDEELGLYAAWENTANFHYKQVKELQAQLDAVRKLQRYDSRVFGHTGHRIQYFKSDDGGIVLWKDVQAVLNGEGNEE